MWAALIPILGEIVLEGMKAWNESRRTRFADQYHDILTALDKARNRPADNWMDSEIDWYEEKLETFLKAYAQELKNESNNNSN